MPTLPCVEPARVPLVLPANDADRFSEDVFGLLLYHDLSVFGCGGVLAGVAVRAKVFVDVCPVTDV